MNAEKYLEEKARLSQALNGQENLDSAVTAITDVLKKYNLNLMPGTAFDVIYLRDDAPGELRLKGKDA